MKKDLLRVLASFVALVVALLIPEQYLLIKVIAFLVSYLIVGYDVVWEALTNIIRGHIFD